MPRNASDRPTGSGQDPAFDADAEMARVIRREPSESEPTFGDRIRHASADADQAPRLRPKPAAPPPPTNEANGDGRDGHGDPLQLPALPCPPGPPPPRPPGPRSPQPPAPIRSSSRRIGLGDAHARLALNGTRLNREGVLWLLIQSAVPNLHGQDGYGGHFGHQHDGPITPRLLGQMHRAAGWETYLTHPEALDKVHFHRLGAYFVPRDGQPHAGETRLGVIDIDDKGHDYDPDEWRYAASVATACLAALRKLGLAGTACISTHGKGAQIWLVVNVWIPAEEMIRVLASLTASGEVQTAQAECPRRIRIESIFPKQARVDADRPGSVVALPLAGMSRLLDEHGEITETVPAAVIDAATFRQVAASITVTEGDYLLGQRGGRPRLHAGERIAVAHVPDHLRQYLGAATSEFDVDRVDDPFDLAQMRAAVDWLVEHPEGATYEIRQHPDGPIIGHRKIGMASGRKDWLPLMFAYSNECARAEAVGMHDVAKQIAQMWWAACNKAEALYPDNESARVGPTDHEQWQHAVALGWQPDGIRLRTVYGALNDSCWEYRPDDSHTAPEVDDPATATALEPAAEDDAVITEVPTPKTLCVKASTGKRESAVRRVAPSLSLLGQTRKWSLDEVKSFPDTHTVKGKGKGAGERWIIETTAENVAHCLKMEGCEIWFNVLTHEVACDRLARTIDSPPALDTLKEFVNSIFTRNGVAMPEIADKLNYIARANPINPATRFSNRLRWDGKPRFHELEELLLLADPTEANIKLRAAFIRVLLLSSVAAADRAEIGIRHGFERKFEYIPTIQGGQGEKKSTFLRRSLPKELREYFYSAGNFDPTDEKKVLALAPFIRVELAEIDQALDTKRKAGDLKAFTSQHRLRIRRAYARAYEDVIRNFVMCGTTNEITPLRDDTGNRRFIPIAVTDIDVTRLEPDAGADPAIDYIDLDQVWAEAWYRYKILKERWWPTDAELKVIEPSQEAHTYRTEMEEKLLDSYEGFHTLPGTMPRGWEKGAAGCRVLSSTEIAQEIGIIGPGATVQIGKALAKINRDQRGHPRRCQKPGERTLWAMPKLRSKLSPLGRIAISPAGNTPLK